MSDTVIRVEGLGKKYIIGHQQERERYVALRDVMARGAKSLLRAINPLERKRRMVSPDREEFWALKDVSFEVKRGDRIGIIGRNGAGKSTLLKILSRITEPTTGRVQIRGRVASLLEVGTGFHPELTGRENIYLNGAILGMSRAEIRRKFDEIVAFAEVERFLDTPVKRYSSGMYVRLAFAVAAHLEPEILVVDEVLAVGDAAFQKKCLGKMEDIAGHQGKTILFVSHNMIAIRNLCDRAIYLKEGEIKDIGLAENVIQTYIFNSTAIKENIVNTRNILFKADDLDIISLSVEDDNDSTRTIFKTSENIYIRINFLLKRRIPNLRIGIDLYSISLGETIFRSFDDDLDTQLRIPNHYISVARIPAYLIKPGLYLIKLLVGVHGQYWIIHDSISIQIEVEHVDGVNNKYLDKRPGIIMPALEWNVKILNS